MNMLLIIGRVKHMIVGKLKFVVNYRLWTGP